MPGPAGSSAVTAAPALDAETRALAALAYGEASTKDVFEEMAAIAIVVLRQQKARGYSSVSTFLATDKTYAYAASDKNPRYKLFVRSTDAQVSADSGMSMAVRAVNHARTPNAEDYSNGAFFWDGYDIRTNYAKHDKVKKGIKITDPAHNVVGIEDKEVPGEEWWRDAKGNKTKLRGRWSYRFQSTAGWGGTIFWKYNPDFIKGASNSEYN
ncbi:hypothetical protein G8A07_00065 [Roseateles sp. DAIF2]|nr:hypothetical protein G8A07_00065 [Roseateles sp. DAIF2]